MRWNLPQDRIPEAWFNVAPHLPQPLRPPLHPGTKEPVGPDDLAPLFPMALIGQEMTAEPWVDIPGQVLDVLRLWRPTPLVRAERLEQALGTPADLLQGRIGLACGLAQTEHGRSPGVLQQCRRSKAAHHRDRRGPMGERSCFRYMPFRHGMQGLYGEGLVRAEAVPQGDDGDLGCERGAVTC